MRELEADGACTVDWRPVNGAELRVLRGNDPFTGTPVSGQYDWAYRERDARMWADFYGIPFREPPTHRFDFDLLVRAATAAKRLDAASEYAWGLCSIVYASDIWPVDDRACTDLAQRLGLDVAAFRGMLADPQTAQRASAVAADAHRRGAFGVPTFFLGEKMFWGNDRIVLLEHALGRRG
jgi:2-hydroxychromene-2-carboxylate isomerase